MPKSEGGGGRSQGRSGGRSSRDGSRRDKAEGRAKTKDRRGADREARGERPYHRENLRRDLIDRGRALLVRDGLGAFSLRALAQDLGVSHAAPYRHFPTREELLAEILREGMARFEEALLASASIEGDEEENLYRLGEAYVLFFLDNPEVLALFGLMPGIIAESGGSLGKLFSQMPDADGSSENPDLMGDAGFLTLRRAAAAFLGKYPRLSERDVLLGFWAKAHGLASLLVSQPDWFAPEELRKGLARVIRAPF